MGNQPIKDLNSYMRNGLYYGVYVAPETIKGEWSIKNDLFSIGGIMFFFLTG